MTYAPTVIKTTPPERLIRPGQDRFRQTITQSQLATPACRQIDRDIAHAMITSDPKNSSWSNSVTGGPEGTLVAGYNARDYTYFDDELHRWAIDWKKYQEAVGTGYIYYGATTDHPLYLSTGFGVSCWVKFDAAAVEQRFLTLSRATLPCLLLGTHNATANKFRIFIYEAAGSSIDLISTETYSTNEWLKICFAWNGGNNIAMSMNGTQLTLTGTATAPASAVGLGSTAGQTAWSRNINGKLADLIVWDKHVTLADQQTFMGPMNDASLTGYVRGATFPQQLTTTHRAALQGTLQEDFVLDDENPIAEGVRNYWPIVSPTHLTDYGPDDVPMDYVSTGYQMNQVSWYKNAWGARAYGTGHHYRAKDLGDIWPVGTCTVSCWCNNSATITSSLFGNFTYVLAERFNLHCTWSDGNIYWDWGGFTAGTSRIVATMPANYFRNTWRHVLVYAKEAVGMGIWVDGKLVASHTSASTPARAGTRTQGDSTLMTGAGYRYEGSIAEMVVWDRLLSDAEKVEMYQNPLVLRKYRQSGRPSGKTWLPPTPVAPASNAYTLLPRATQVEHAPAEVNAEGMTVRQASWVAHCKAYFKPNNNNGSACLDRMKHTPTLLYLAANWNVNKLKLDPKYGYVYDFVAASIDRCTCESFTQNEIAFAANTGWTIEGLIKPDSVTSTQYIFTHGQVNSAFTPNLNFAFRSEGAQLRFIYRNSANTAFIYATTNSNVLAIGRWNHVMYTHNGFSGGAFYVDGELAASTDTGSVLTAPQTSNTPLKWASRYDQGTGTHGTPYDGQIAFMRIYQKFWFHVADAAELAQLVLAGKDPFDQQLLITPGPVCIPERHWAGEDGDWFTARNWSRAAGGVRGAGVPNCENPVLFDAERPVYPEDY